MCKKNLNSFLRTSVCLLLLSCSTTEYDESMKHASIKKQNDQRKVQLFDDEVEPQMPDLKINNESILGIDSNDNKIRDDIEIWINRTGKNYNERKAMKQYAQSKYEYYIEVDRYNSGTSSGTNKKEEIFSKIADAADCVAFIFDYPGYSIPYHINDKIESLMTNTNMREKSSWEYFNNSLFAVAGGGSRGDPSLCKFKVEKKEQIKESNLLLEKIFEKRQKEQEEIKKKKAEEDTKVRMQRYNLMKKTKDEQKPLIEIND